MLVHCLVNIFYLSLNLQGNILVERIRSLEIYTQITLISTFCLLTGYKQLHDNCVGKV